MQPPQELEWIDGRVTLVFPPSLRFHSVIDNHQKALQKRIIGVQVYPPDQWENSILEKTFPFIQEIARLINQDHRKRWGRGPIIPRKVTPRSLYHFFICTDPVTMANGEQRLGLSGIEQLLGYSYRETDEPVSEAPFTTGNPALDITVGCTMIFKRQARWMLENYGLEELSEMSSYANKILEKAHRKDEESWQPTLVEFSDRDEFTTRAEQIQKTLETMGVLLPSAFSKTPVSGGD